MQRKMVSGISPSTTDRIKLAQLFASGSNDNNKKIEYVKNLYYKYDVKKIAEFEMEKYYGICLQSLEKVNVDDERKIGLTKIAGLIHDRNF